VAARAGERQGARREGCGEGGQADSDEVDAAREVGLMAAENVEAGRGREGAGADDDRTGEDAVAKEEPHPVPIGTSGPGLENQKSTKGRLAAPLDGLPGWGFPTP
jgi:hypothetical protein